MTAIALPAERLRALAKRFGTPLYVYDFDVVTANVEALKKALGPRFTLAYAIKANPSRAIVAHMAGQGLSFDVASAGELANARLAGAPPARIVATGPAKSDGDLEALVHAGISQLHAEGEWELDRLEAIATRRKRRVAVGLRLNPPFAIAENRPIIGGAGAAKFGFDLPSARRVLERQERWPHLSIQGFQVFNASNVLDAGLFTENVRRVLELAVSLAKRHDVPLATVDFGGGFGVPYGPVGTPLDLGALAKGLAEAAAWAAGEPRLARTRLLFEPGRYLVAESGLYLTRVLGVKRTKRQTIALVDGGIHHFLRPALVEPHPVEVVGKRGRTGRVLIGGPLCTSLDVLHADARIPLPEAGDLLAFRNAGAYGYTESMPLFLSREWPAEIGVKGGRAVALRRGPAVSELLAAQRARI